MTFTEFLKKVDDTFMTHQAARSKSTDNPVSASNQLRYGQTIMNVLHDVWHKKYLEISDSDLNCFYTNRNVAMVLDKLEKEWIYDSGLNRNVAMVLDKLEKEWIYDSGLKHYFPINDNNSRFDLVEIKTTHTKAAPTPHCKIHGAMNCVAIHTNGRLWRCIQSCQLKDCRAGCEEKHES